MVRLSGLLKPEYLLNPRQLVSRLGWALSPPKQDRLTARTPWGWPIDVSSHDDISRALLHLGVYDLAVSEVICRLCDAGETALDLGANVGLVTALLARRVGATGRVLGFEAHPEIARDLRANVARWRDLPGAGAIEVFDVALSDHDGSVQLGVPADFGHNRGISRVVDGPDAGTSVVQTFAVPCATLDSFLDGVGPVGLAKMDVEGHEEAVLRGARRALDRGAVRDWVFEHHPDYPSPVTGLFEASGYALYQIHKRFFRAELVPMSRPLPRPAWEPRSYLATLDPARALGRLEAWGWRVLRS
jgi:FkbM family methyltransferase